VKRAILCLGALLCCRDLSALSVLTHEAIIDSAWDDGIQPMLRRRFPAATPDDLLKAHAYAYGGCIIQDMGYYPFGSRFFTDLVHYVRSGDFVVNLLKDAQDLDDYAFALGALAHYAADNNGHSIGVNPSVGIEYPKLRRRFGPIVTYSDDRTSHLRVEFSFDVQQVAHGNYAPKSYHDFIGFEVAKPLLDQAFQDTYSLRLEDIFSSLDLALGMYRYTVSHLIPDMTRAAWKLHRNELLQADPKLTRRRFIYRISRADYRKEWGQNEPGIGVRTLEFFVRILPKIGPLRVVAFKPPAPAATADFEQSFIAALDQYTGLLKRSVSPGFQLPDRDLDTGKLTRSGEYRLTDDTYAKLAVRLSTVDAAKVNPGVRDSILAFYRDQDAPDAVKKHRKEWQRTMEAVARLRSEITTPSGADRGQ
jgi:hypothetical protein